ncbi:hypothetical protein PF005_g5857 [Phytophthora fragariae]|uniref:Uncharacterized protein n=1 Tax=Phytophthora fragariae TaxID=53985 RepID=A0A6A3YW36_9STRA|nr:hypothetical protein PF007_g6263 [Phytophthora fragariae]KAE9224604.1 hypothetical protein PF005_g5857 [Phytophthora fragariae]
MATQEAQEVTPGGQERRTSLRPRKEVDYVQAAMGRLTKEHISDGDYVQDEIDGEEDYDDGEEVEEVEDSDDGEEVEGSDDGEEVEGSGNGEEVEDSDDGEDVNAGEDGEGMDAGGDDVEEGDDGEDVVEEGGDDEEGEDLVEEGDADAENAYVTADDDADENMVGRTTTTPGLSRHLRILFASLNNGKYCKFCKRNNHSDAECFRNPESLAYRPRRPNNRGSGTNSSHNNGGNDRAFAAMQEQVAEMAAMLQELKRRQEEELNSLRFYRQDELSVMIDDELVDEQPPVDERAETLAAL